MSQSSLRRHCRSAWWLCCDSHLPTKRYFFPAARRAMAAFVSSMETCLEGRPNLPLRLLSPFRRWAWASQSISLATMQSRLYVSFWDLELSNLPVGSFRRRVLPPAEARGLILAARASGLLLCVAKEDLGAPYGERAREKHRQLCEALREHVGWTKCVGALSRETSRGMLSSRGPRGAHPTKRLPSGPSNVEISSGLCV